MIALLLALQFDVVVERDLAYVDGDADKKQKLNLYMPKTDKPVPVLMWIHGGGWRQGDRALYSTLGRRFAERGIGCALISYRLSPDVQHPEHIKDCAAAFAWLHANVKKYGGDPDRLFISGQSAGGHLTALLATDRKYFDDLKLPADVLKGAVPMSGVYEVGGSSFYRDAFGDDKAARADASPLSHVKDFKLPMLVITETDDNYHLRPDMEKLKKAFDGAKNVSFLDADDRNHITIVTRMMLKADDPARDAIVDFIKKRCEELK